MIEKMGRRPQESEIRSWNNSLRYMSNIVVTSKLPDNTGIAIEYNIPYTSKRVDMIISGMNENGQNSAIIIELKQWDEAYSVPEKDAIVKTYLNGNIRETNHPSYQAWSYAAAIMNFNVDIQDQNIELKPCAYLHNYDVYNDDPLSDTIYLEYLNKAPIFKKHDGKKLQQFIERFIQKGDDGKTIYYIENGRLRPSKSLQDSLRSMIEGNKEFILLDSQKVVYEMILDHARKINTGGPKKAIIVKGGPGTGKTVIAIDLLCAIINLGMTATYVTKNSAPRNVYKEKLKGRKKKSDIDALFRNPDGFWSYKTTIYDVTLADEAHRLRRKSGVYSNQGENQIKEIMKASRLSVFFVDDDQKVTTSDVGSIEEIGKQAKYLNIPVTLLELDSQFRCNGSDGYLSWIDNVLEIKQTANYDIDKNWGYDFHVFDNPNDLRNAIVEKNKINNRSRIVAGYCWEWKKEKRNDPTFNDITIPEFNFGMSWNMENTGTWSIDDNSINEAGCIHTCQGLEFDYVGVIIGEDLRYEDGSIITDASKRAKTDQSLKGLKTKYSNKEASIIAEKIIKNTYKVLMTRGMKGCYIYCMDKQLRDYLITRSKQQ